MYAALSTDFNCHCIWISCQFRFEEATSLCYFWLLFTSSKKDYTRNIVSYTRLLIIVVFLGELIKYNPFHWGTDPTKSHCAYAIPMSPHSLRLPTTLVLQSAHSIILSHPSCFLSPFTGPAHSVPSALPTIPTWPTSTFSLSVQVYVLQVYAHFFPLELPKWIYHLSPTDTTYMYSIQWYIS